MKGLVAQRGSVQLHALNTSSAPYVTYRRATRSCASTATTSLALTVSRRQPASPSRAMYSKSTKRFTVWLALGVLSRTGLSRWS